jgi:hypothetical protein
MTIIEKSRPVRAAALRLSSVNCRHRRAMRAIRFYGGESETDRGRRLSYFYNMNELKRLIADP